VDIVHEDVSSEAADCWPLLISGERTESTRGSLSVTVTSTLSWRLSVTVKLALTVVDSWSRLSSLGLQTKIRYCTCDLVQYLYIVDSHILWLAEFYPFIN